MLKKILLLGVIAIIGIVSYCSLTSVWRNPAEATHYISKLTLPNSAQLLEEKGDSYDHYYVWSVPSDFLQNLEPPSDVYPPFDPYGNMPSSWSKLELGYFGQLDAAEIPSDAEAFFYRTSFWSVALIRSMSTSTLIVAGIYTN